MHTIGGVQLQTFTFTGTEAHGRSGILHITHGSDVHVTVVATNRAGLSSVIHSVPQTVDFTPPVICCIKVSQGRLLQEASIICL